MDVEWKYLKGLHQLYKERRTSIKLLNCSFINTVLYNQRKLLAFKTGNHSVMVPKNSFNEYYEKEFLEYYLYYQEFFDRTGLENNAKKSFTEQDLKALVFVYYNKEELRLKLTSVRKFSAKLFKNENTKYIENKPSLKNAILELLEIEEFPEQDPKNNQWRLVVDCEDPRYIVLCENLDCLKVPLEYKNNNVELWYVGGNNTLPLLDISKDKLQLPIFYFCDWDYDGLKIFTKVREIFEAKDKLITIIEPAEDAKKLPVGVKHHRSKWRKEKFSGLKADCFSEGQRQLIEVLIAEDSWIEEESLDMFSSLKIIESLGE